MIRRIFEQVVVAISAPATETTETDRDGALRLATAVLMVEVARADHVFEETEFDHLLALIERHFDLSPDAAAELVNLAGETAEESVSLHDFTQRLHQDLDEREKARIVALLWQIAYADGHLDKYEDSLVLKISDLLYVSRGRVMGLKHEAEQNRPL